jgi:hypothetical protein
MHVERMFRVESTSGIWCSVRGPRTPADSIPGSNRPLENKHKSRRVRRGSASADGNLIMETQPDSTPAADPGHHIIRLIMRLALSFVGPRALHAVEPECTEGPSLQPACAASTRRTCAAAPPPSEPGIGRSLKKSSRSPSLPGSPGLSHGEVVGWT